MHSLLSIRNYSRNSSLLPQWREMRWLGRKKLFGYRVDEIDCFFGKAGRFFPSFLQESHTSFSTAVDVASAVIGTRRALYGQQTTILCGWTSPIDYTRRGLNSRPRLECAKQFTAVIQASLCLPLAFHKWREETQLVHQTIHNGH